MASDKMDMSLDDIIKQNKGNRGNGNRRGPSNKGGAKRFSGGADRDQRNRPQGGITRRQVNHTTHSKREAFLGNTSRGSLKTAPKESTKLIVSNLDFGVTDSDILELFSEFGPLKHAGVHYDRSGRSLGTADLIFERRGDALKAMKQYNGVPLDGRSMKIMLATSEIPSSRPSIQQSRLGGGGIRKLGDKPNQRHSNASGGKPRNKPDSSRGKKITVTAEELDAQLDEYIKSHDTSLTATTNGA
ncbi:hypothetical protein TKK_0016041 [Trichogramma kaykai]|uniref:RRM domain-containing protein n=1 Tax=Trichogramma kaykai TaxID=54128 RepID=A0ABD2W8V8_9HYME